MIYTITESNTFSLFNPLKPSVGIFLTFVEIYLHGVFNKLRNVNKIDN